MVLFLLLVILAYNTGSLQVLLRVLARGTAGTCKSFLRCEHTIHDPPCDTTTVSGSLHQEDKQ